MGVDFRINNSSEKQETALNKNVKNSSAGGKFCQLIVSNLGTILAFPYIYTYFILF